MAGRHAAPFLSRSLKSLFSYVVRLSRHALIFLQRIARPWCRNKRNLPMSNLISYAIAIALGLATFSLEVRAQDTSAPSTSVNWCKGRTQDKCNAAVACSWRETITDGVSKTSCIYNAKAAKAMVARQVSGN